MEPGKIGYPWLAPHNRGNPGDMKLLTDAHVIAMLRDRVAREGGTYATAAPRLGVSDALLGAVLSTHGFRRQIGPQILKALGLRRVVLYEPIPRRSRVRSNRRRA